MSFPSLQWESSTRSARAPSITADQWENHKLEITTLYEKMTLDDLMVSMKVRHRFTPSRRQYVIQFQKWELHKYKNKPDSKSPPPVPSKVRINTFLAASASSSFHDIQPRINSRRAANTLEHNGASLRALTENRELSLSSPRLKSAALGHPQARDKQGEGITSLKRVLEEDWPEFQPTGKRAKWWPQQSPLRPEQLEPASNRRFVASGMVHDGNSDGTANTDKEEAPANRELTPILIRPKTHAWHESNFDILTVPKTDLMNIYPSTRRMQASDEHEFLSSIRQDASKAIDQSHLLDDSHLHTPSSDAVKIVPGAPAFGSPASGVLTLSDDEDTWSDIEQRQVVTARTLLEYAKSGKTPEAPDPDDLEQMRKAADFFFGVDCLEDAFPLYTLVHRCLKAVPSTTPDDLVRSVVAIARSSCTSSQHIISRHLLSQLAREHEKTANPASCQRFLLQAFLAVVCGKQGDSLNAEHHRKVALQEYNRCRRNANELSDDWKEASAVAYSQLYSILGPDQHLSTPEVLLARRIGYENEQQTFSRPWRRSHPLRGLLKWCLKSLDLQEVDYGSWRNLENVTKQNRLIESTALFCQFWQHWCRDGEDTTSLLNNTWKVGADLEEKIGISAAESFAIVARIACNVPVPRFGDAQTLMQKVLENPNGLVQVIIRQIEDEMFEKKLSEKAKHGISKLLECSDHEIAMTFSVAYLHISKESSNMTDTEGATFEALRRQYVMTAAANLVEIELSSFEIDHPPLEQQDAENSALLQSQGPSSAYCTCGPTLNPSLRTDDSSMGSLRELQGRIRRELIYTTDTVRSQTSNHQLFGSVHSNDQDLEVLLGVAERSLKSMSISASSKVTDMVADLEAHCVYAPPQSIGKVFRNLHDRLEGH